MAMRAPLFLFWLLVELATQTLVQRACSTLCWFSYTIQQCPTTLAGGTQSIPNPTRIGHPLGLA